MFASYEYQLSKDDYLRGLKAVSRSIVAHDSHRGRQSVEQIGFLFLILLVASLLIPDSFDAVLLTLVLTVAGGCVLQMRLARRWREITFDPRRANVALTFDQQGFVIKRLDAEGRYAWDALRRVHELPEAVIIETSDWHAFTLPDQLWAKPEERAEFLTKVRSLAKHLLPDLPTVGAMRWPTFVQFLGAAAFALDVMILMGQWLADIGDCSCTFRHSFVGQLLAIAPLASYCAAFAVAWIGLRRLDRRWPRVALSVATLFIVVFIASQAIPPALQIYQFFSPPAP